MLKNKFNMAMPFLEGDPNFKPKASKMDSPIAGQALTEAPRTLPYDRPPQHAKVNEAIHELFMNIVQPRRAAQLLSVLEAGFPVSTLAEIIAKNGAQEGKWSIVTVPLLAPALTVILVRMAQAAKVDFNYTPNDMPDEEIPHIMLKMREAQISGARADAASQAGRKSVDLAEKHLKVAEDEKGFV